MQRTVERSGSYQRAVAGPSVSRYWIPALFAVLVATFPMKALATGSLAGETIQSLRGALPNQSFLSDGEVESINTANGNVMLSVPLGQVFSVGPHIRYQLRVTNNSDAWDHAPVTSFNVLVSLPHRSSNAGVGWEVHFGKLFAPEPPSGLNALEKDTWPNRQHPSLDGGRRWLYVAPDGSAHYLYKLGGRPSEYSKSRGDSQILRYSKDGSYLRLRQISSTQIIIEHPNGVISDFRKTDSSLGTLSCGGGVSGCWRFKEMRDYYGNKVEVSYHQPTGSKERWRISDSTGRVHSIYFHLDEASRAGGDAGSSNPLELPNGDELGDLRRLVDEVQVAAPHGGTATYDFNYQIRTIPRARPHAPLSDWPSSASSIKVPLLTGIEVPDSADYSFSYHTGDTLRTGRIERVQFPTQGQYEYGYGHWRHPTRCVWSVDPTVEHQYTRTGLKTKKHLTPGGEEIAQWSYSSSLHPAIPGSQIDGPNCKRADYRQTVVKTPLVDGRYTERRLYHSVTIGPKYPTSSNPIGSWQVTDSGLPYNKDVKIGNENNNYLFLSEQTFDCDPDCVEVRQKYVRYAMEWRTCSTVLAGRDPSECFQINPILVRERTVFKDDGNRWVERRLSGLDGAGHHRTVEIVDNFEGGERTVERYTGYNATGSTELSINPNTGYVDVGSPASYLPQPTSSWILTPFDTQIRSDSGLTYRTNYNFDSKGSVTCMRKRKVDSQDGSRDLVTRYYLGASAGVNAGLPVTEIVAGGENGALGNGTCNTSGSEGTNKFTFAHGYQHLAHASTRIGSFPYRFRADIDRNTGLPAATYNVSDQRTDYTYDRLGRPTLIKPAASLGEAETAIVYTNEPGVEARVYVERRFNGSRYADEQAIYDFFGRLRREVQSLPTGLGSHADSERETVYDAVGRVSAVSTVQQASNVNSDQYVTSYLDYDPFGRPAVIERPDDYRETRVYKGVRETRSTVHVRVSETGTTAVTTTVRSDGLGRPISASNPSYTVVSRYDPKGRKLEVERRKGTFSQKREYGWDNRDLLVFEKHPEVGNGSVNHIWLAPDALGNPSHVFDGQRTVSHEYDGDGRLVRKRVGSRLWEEFSWANANSGSDYRKGKIVQATRHNYPDGVYDWAVVEKYQYRGKLAQMSHRTTQLQFPTDAVPANHYGPTFEQTWDYNVLGEVVEESYPICVTTPENGRRFCNDPSDLTGPAHTVSRTMNQRLPVRVASSLGVSADYAYHWNYQLKQMTYSNGASTHLGQGTRGMRRPASIEHRNAAGAVVFSSGTYRYDGAGNIWEIGPDRYTYDHAGRLTRGTARSPSLWEEYLYDPADNLVRVVRDDGTTTNWNVDTNKNRLLGTLGTPPNIAYDGAGNVDRVGPAAAPIFDLDHDDLNMLTRFHEPGSGRELRYVYAPGNHRLITIDASTQERVWALRGMDGRRLREHRVSGWGYYQSAAQPGAVWEFVKDHVYGPNGLIATRDRGGVKTFFHQDHLGTPRVVTDAFGAKVGNHDYYPYGNEASNSGADEPASKFAGHELDDHQVTYYMLARTYSHAWSRFANVDPARQGWNLYSYASNNPINRVDPDGRADSSVSEEVHIGAEVTAGLPGFVMDLVDIVFPPKNGTVRPSNISFGIQVSMGNEEAALQAVVGTMVEDVGVNHGEPGWFRKIYGKLVPKVSATAVIGGSTQTPSGAAGKEEVLSASLPVGSLEATGRTNTGMTGLDLKVGPQSKIGLEVGISETFNLLTVPISPAAHQYYPRLAPPH